MGKVVSGITGALGLTADSGAGMAESAAARSLQERAVRELEKLDVPTVEAQRIVLERPELVGVLVPEMNQDTAMVDISTSPEYAAAQMQALQGAQEQAEAGGFTPDMLARFEALRRQSGGDDQARQASILQSMQERGQGGSGSELAARLASSQAATQRSSQAASDLVSQAPGARLQALESAGNMAGQMRSQDYGEKSNVAQARDTINQFNTGLRNQAQATNLNSRQNIANERSRIGREEEVYNKGLLQQDFNNRFQKASGTVGQLQNLSQGYMQESGARANAAQQEAAGIRGLATTAAGFALAGPMGGALASQVASPAPSTIDPNDYNGRKDGGIKRDNYADGGVERDMAYADGGMGTIIPGESFAGDELPDRINSGEMILNVDSQDNIKKLLEQRSRGDEQLASGEAQLNPEAQDELMAVARGQMSPEEMSDKPIVEDKKTKMQVLQELLEALR